MDPHRGKILLRWSLEWLEANIRLQLVNENIFRWRVALIVLNPDSLYYGGYFLANMTFPQNYPYSPPGKIRFLTPTAVQLLTQTRLQVQACALSP